MTQNETKGVLVLYTGGTIGAVRQNPNNPDSPLVPGQPEDLVKHLPIIQGDRMIIKNQTVGVHVAKLLPRPDGKSFIDASDMTPEDWKRIAHAIRDQYDQYDGFVILHGTDTMSFTASALSFMLENLAKPVVITGSQRPIGETRSDALQNIVTSIEIAAARCLGTTVVPEVCVFFHDKLLRGCRTTKLSASAYDGFQTPNLPPLGNAGEHIRISKKLLNDPPKRPLAVHTELDTKIAVIELSPLMNHQMLQRILSSKDLHAVVLKTYGTGNAPTDPQFLSVIGEAIRREENPMRIVNVTQCPEGTVEPGLYEVSTGLLERGVLSGLDMTSEAAQTKISYLLANDRSSDPPEALMTVNLRGEQTQNLFDLKLPGTDWTTSATVHQQGPFPASGYFHEDKITSAKLRIFGFEIGPSNEETFQLSLFFNEQNSGESPMRSQEDRLIYQGIHDPSGEPESLFIDVTRFAKKQIHPNWKTKVTIVSDSGLKVRWASMSLAIFTEA